MRLIDGDAIIDEYCGDCAYRCTELCDENMPSCGTARWIKDAPAVDAVELPCKIGDKVWIARRYKCHKRPRWGIVSEMFFTDDMELCIVVKGVARGKWGVDVFATYEEAEKQIEINNRKD